jgi:phosphoglycolate phosphatase
MNDLSTDPSPARPRRFDLIVFDWDGTLFDSTALIVQSIQAACRDLGLPVPGDSEASWVIGLSLRAAMEHAVPGLAPENYPLMVDRYRHHYFERRHALTLFPGVLGMLQALKKRHHWLAVATGKSRNGLDEALETVELKGVFDATRTADETRSKPDPLMLTELMRHFGVDPDRTVMVGDTTHDLQLAANAGTPSIAVSYGAHDPSEFATHSPMFTAQTVAELADWLEQHA